MNVTCSATNVCTTILNSTCVYYTGDDLIYTGIVTNDNLTTALEKINAKFQDAGLGYAFENGITQAIPSAPVKLGGLLTENTVITSNGHSFTVTENLIAGSIIKSGGLSTQFLKANGSVDSTTYQPAGSYLTALTGDATASGPGSAALTLATVNTNPGTFGNSTNVPVVTVNAKGLVTSVTTTAISLPASTLSFSGDVTGLGNTGTPVTLTLNTVNSNPYGSNTFLRFAVNAKGLVTSATPVTQANIISLIGYTPVPETRTITINGIQKDLTLDRVWNIDALPIQTGSAGKFLFTDGIAASWQDLQGNLSQFYNDVGYIIGVPTLNDVLNAGNTTTLNMSVGDITTTGVITANLLTANGYTFQDGSTFTTYTSYPRAWTFPDADGVVTLSVNNYIPDPYGNINIPIGNGTVTSVGGTGGANGLYLSGNVTDSGYIELGGSLILQFSDITNALGFTPYNDVNPSGFITSADLSPYLTIANASYLYYPASNPNNFITKNSISTADNALGYNDGVIYIQNGFQITTYDEISKIYSAYSGRIAGVTNNGNNGVASYNFTTNVLNVPDYTIAGLGGITADFITATAPILSYNSGTGVIAHATGDGYLHVPPTGTTNDGKYLKAGGTPGSFSWETIDTSLQNILNQNHELFNAINFQGTYAGFGNTGTSNINGFGGYAASSNSGSNVNAFGEDAARNSSGSHVNALGNQAGFNNTHSYVNLLGKNAAATGNNQTVLAGQTYKAILSYNDLTTNVTHKLPSDNGTYMLSVNGKPADGAGNVEINIDDLNGVPKARKLTINNAEYDLSQDRSWTIPGVTSVSASVPSAFNVNITNPTTTPAIAISANGTAGQYIKGDGSLGVLPTSGSGGSGANVSYFLNGSVNQGTFSGFTYYEMSKDPIIDTGGDFTLTNSAGYISRFVTDANDPSLLSIPGGNWTFNFYMGASDNTGSPTFYVELYKMAPTGGGTFTLIGSTSGSPTPINNGTVPTTYTATLAIVTTNLLIDDRLAIRVYVNTAGNRTITLYTQETNLSQVITTFAKGITSLNTLTATVQSFAVGTSGSNFNISSDGPTQTHTFNIPDASSSARGLITTGAQIIAGIKTFNSPITGSITNLTGGSPGSVPYQFAANTTQFVSPGTSGQALISNGASAPSFGTLGIGAGGTGQTTRQAAINALVSDSAPANKTFLRGNGTNVSMAAIDVNDFDTTLVYNLSINGTATNLSGTPAAKTFYAGPVTGVGAAPDFRAIAATDLPPSITSATSGSAGSINGSNVITRANLVNGIAKSVMGVAGNATAAIADIQSSGADQVLRVNNGNTAIEWGTIDTGGIKNRAVDFTKIKAINTTTILGRTTAGSGDIEELAPATVTGMLNQFSTTSTVQGLVKGSNNLGATYYLNATGNWTVVETGYTLETKTADWTYTTPSGELIILVDNNTNNVTITIPNANSSKAKITVKKIGTSTSFNLIINVTGGGTIDNSSTIDLTSALRYTSITMVSDNANWFII